METNDLIVLKTDVEAQMALINATVEKLEERARGVGADDVVRMESVA